MSVVSFIWLLFFVRSLQAYVTYIEVKYPLEGKPAAPGTPWPLPRYWIQTPKLLTLNPRQFTFSTDARKCDIIEKAIKRYKDIIRRTAGNGATTLANVPVLSSLQVTVTSFQGVDCSYPYAASDESYIINLKNGHSSLHASTTWGALRGLETFSQLIYVGSGKTCLVNETYIKDYPRFTHRSVLLDTARHFLPLNTIKQNLDAMSYNKFNVFHWHIVDDQSWPLQLKSFPNVSKLGAYTDYYVYSHDDVKEVIEYARLRGIRVIPEIDTPGHTQALGKALPNMLSACYDNGKKGIAVREKHAAYEILDPTKDYTYDTMEIIFSEVKRLFKDEYIHLGMDEVYYECWETSPEIRAFMESMGFRNISEVEQHYLKRTLRNVKDIHYKYIIWQDPIDNDIAVDKSAIVTVWKDMATFGKMAKWQDGMTHVTSKGYKSILSGCWYLNIIKYGADWEDLYRCDPQEFDGTTAMKDLVIGGEACMWGEFVDDTNIIQRLWPRASVVAEKLWSDGSLKIDDAAYRLDQHRCRMLHRGIAAQPILNGFCEMGDVQDALPLALDGGNLLMAAVITVSMSAMVYCLVRLMRHRWMRVVSVGAVTLKRKTVPGTHNYARIW